MDQAKNDQKQAIGDDFVKIRKSLDGRENELMTLLDNNYRKRKQCIKKQIESLHVQLIECEKVMHEFWLVIHTFILITLIDIFVVYVLIIDACY